MIRADSAASTDTTEELARTLNRDCHCISIDAEILRRELERDMENRGLYSSVIETRPHLFSASAVFVSRAEVERMAALIHAVESVVALPEYRSTVLSWAPAIARIDHGTRGVFLSYDFHLGPAGPQLIEINTNAGGALLNAVLARAQRACCDKVRHLTVGPVNLTTLEQTLFDMFLSEWRLQRGAQQLFSVAIVDDGPAQQYLFPEFILFEQLFKQRGLACFIADPNELSYRDGSLWRGDLRIDLVYNRLTDFSLERPEHASLRAAYVDGAVVLTPHPRAHALYADKRNLALLTDHEQLGAWGVPDSVRNILRAGIPATVLIESDDAERIWAERRKLFFKPVSGFGSKAAYRGDKLTRRAWSEILAGQYVAQETVPPSERRLRVAGEEVSLKLDMRNYVYNGAIQLLSARLYRGQTTNFRTPGGGFAPVFYPDPSEPPG